MRIGFLFTPYAAHQAAWRDDPHDQPSRLGPPLERAFSSHPTFEPEQEAVIRHTFHSEPGDMAAERGAWALLDVLWSDADNTGDPIDQQTAAPDLLSAAS